MSRLKEIKKIIEGGAESMPFVSWYFVQKVGHGHNKWGMDIIMIKNKKNL